MKHLYLVRHAKSNWPEGKQSDFERTLDKRGKQDAPKMGDLLKTRYGVQIDHVLCSSAKRARATAKRLLDTLGYPLEQVDWKKKIYSGNASDLLDLICGVEDQYQSVMMIGHNPYISNLAGYLMDDDVRDMPTCGVFGMTVHIEKWAFASQGLGEKLFFTSPKDL